MLRQRASLSLVVLSLFGGSPALSQDTAGSQDGQAITLGGFRLAFSGTRGGLATLERADDPTHVNILAPRIPEHPDGLALGDVVIRYRRQDTEWRSPGNWTTFTTAGARHAIVRTSGAPSLMIGPATLRSTEDQPVSIRSVFKPVAGDLEWQLEVSNETSHELELGDLGIPLPFNTKFRREADPDVTYSRYVLRHALIEGAGSFLYWMRPDGVGPYLLLTPENGTSIGYQDLGTDTGAGTYTAYVHALAQARDIQPNGTWNQPLTEGHLAPAGQAGSTVTISFRLQWARDYADVRDRVVASGGLDIRVLPGMVIPDDLAAFASIRSEEPIESIEPQYPEQTVVTRLPSPVARRALYQFRFRRLGENTITIRWGDNKRSQLEYFVTEPLDILVDKRAAFVAVHQQVRDATKWYDGLFSLWDMQEQKLRTPDDTGGLDEYMVGGSDDPDMSKAPMIAEKNVRYPDDRQIAALEYYEKNFVWGKLQRTDRELPNAYGIYGVPNWKAARSSPDNELGHGQQKVWRSYDYPHLIQFYLAMHRIGKLYPDKLHYLTADQWLDRAYGTARAYFLVPYSIKMDPRTGFPGYNDWSFKLGTMHESHIVDLIDVLKAEGRGEASEWLRAQWEKKVKYFTYDSRLPYGSEMNFDTTAFQSAHALARYGLTRPMRPDRNLWQDKNSGRIYSHPKVSPADFAASMRRSIAANVAARGWLETSYHQLGSDYRGSSLQGFLGYMSQMGGGAILDYGLNFSDKPAEYVGLGYASQLSSWALVNCGTSDQGYEFWYPGAANDGAAGWNYLSLKFGVSVFGTKLVQGRGAWRYDGEIDNGFSEAIGSASTIVVDDPIFGLAAYGGTVRATDGSMHIVSHDEVRQKLYVRTAGLRLDILLDRDGFAKGEETQLADDGSQLKFILENREAQSHRSNLAIKGLRAGIYRCSCGSDDRRIVVSSGQSTVDVAIGVDADRVAVRLWRL